MSTLNGMRRLLTIVGLGLALASLGQPLIVPNMGQWSGDFAAKTDVSDGAVFWRPDGYRIHLVHPKHRGGTKPSPHYPSTDWPSAWPESFAVFVEFSGANPEALTVGSEPTPSPRNYILGSDPKKWTPNVPEYQDWRSQNVYPGIDFLLHAHDGQLKSEWVLAYRYQI